MSLKTYLYERMAATQKIIMIFADHDTQNAMVSWAKKQGFDLTKKFSGKTIEPSEFDFHITIVASANKVFVPTTDHLVEPIKLRAEGFEVLGKEKNIPTLKFPVTDNLGAIRTFFVENHLQEVYGIEPTFEKFKPHMSLSYNWNGQPALKDLKVPPFDIVLDRLIVQEFSS